jgi:hypothetical protein
MEPPNGSQASLNLKRKPSDDVEDPNRAKKKGRVQATPDQECVGWPPYFERVITP